MIILSGLIGNDLNVYLSGRYGPVLNFRPGHDDGLQCSENKTVGRFKSRRCDKRLGSGPVGIKNGYRAARLLGNLRMARCVECLVYGPLQREQLSGKLAKGGVNRRNGIRRLDRYLKIKPFFLRGDLHHGTAGPDEYDTAQNDH